MAVLDHSNSIIYGMRATGGKASILAFKADKNAEQIKNRWKFNKNYSLKQLFLAPKEFVLIDFMVTTNLENQPHFVLLIDNYDHNKQEIKYYDSSNNKFTRIVYDCDECDRFGIVAYNAKLNKLVYWIRRNIAQFAIVDIKTNRIHKLDLRKIITGQLLGMVRDEEGFYWILEKRGSGKASKATIKKLKLA